MYFFYGKLTTLDLFIISIKVQITKNILSFIKPENADLENLTDDALAWLYVTKFSTISLFLTKLYVT